ncbi:MAG: hypothetical protein IJM32_01860, partial [Ruminococcus sp.]|nr:hypothetical protein [Ruminococcus sp.]
KRQGIPPSADGGKGSALDPPAFFYEKKAGRKNLSCLWQVLKGSADPQTLIYIDKKAERGSAFLFDNMGAMWYTVLLWVNRLITMRGQF